MRYPTLKEKAVIGVTAPSSGVPKSLHHLLEQSQIALQKKGYEVVFGETVWTQEKAKSAPAKKRAEELMDFFLRPDIDLIIPPWGGELLMEILDKVDFDNIPEKWLLGYSDTSGLLLAITLKAGIATAQGTNLIDVRGAYADPTTAMWENVLKTELGETVVQIPSEKYQKAWDFENPTDCIFHLTEPTIWKTVGGEPVFMKGRLLGGCIDIVRHLVGTPYGDVARFRKLHTNGEPIIWHFENVEQSATSLKRSLLQMKYAGWFDDCAGVIFGRCGVNQAVDGYTNVDVYEELAEELGVPVAYDLDFGHVPPQMTLVNGAYVQVEVGEGAGKLIQRFI